ncbi:hypothetical protein Tco_0816232 [Tanacetum coccineum]
MDKTMTITEAIIKKPFEVVDDNNWNYFFNPQTQRLFEKSLLHLCSKDVKMKEVGERSKGVKTGIASQDADSSLVPPTCSDSGEGGKEACDETEVLIEEEEYTEICTA